MEKNKAIKGRIENKGKDVMREHWQERGKDGTRTIATEVRSGDNMRAEPRE